MTKKKVSYEDLVVKLQLNHFYPAKEETSSTKGKKITGLRIDSAPIMMDDRKARVEEVLKDYPVKVSTMPNHGYLVVKII